MDRSCGLVYHTLDAHGIVLLWRHGADGTHDAPHTPRGCDTPGYGWHLAPPQVLLIHYTPLLRDFNDVLPSKWGHDEAIDGLEATRDATPVVGEQAQIDYVTLRKGVAEIAWGRIEDRG